MDPRAVRQRCCEKGVLPVDALMADPCHLLGEALQQLIIDFGHFDALHPGARCILNPKLAWSVNQKLCHRLTVQPFSEGLEISIQIHAALRRWLWCKDVWQVCAHPA